jgi:hypothetical protein
LTHPSATIRPATRVDPVQYLKRKHRIERPLTLRRNFLGFALANVLEPRRLVALVETKNIPQAHTYRSFAGKPQGCKSRLDTHRFRCKNPRTIA